MKTLILGIGNPILTDDGVGIKIARQIKEADPELEVVETSEAGIALLDLISGYDKVVIIDSIKTGQGKAGELYKLELADLGHPVYFASSHGIDIPTAVELGRLAGYPVPEHICVYAVEVKDNSSFSEVCTQEVQERIPHIANQIMEQEGVLMPLG
jgi:hydrogenase maturation protease